MTAFPESIHVLHVDDEPNVAELAAGFLEGADERLAVHTATSAEQGLTVLSETAIDCVVSDYDMPGTNGIEFLEAVRETRPDLPFILYTGKGSEEIASEAISAGVTEYMQKGTGTDQYTVLANRITNSVEQYRAEQAAERTRERLAELSRSTTDCLWLFDRDWAELLFISGYEDVWGRPESAIREDPRDFLQAVHPDDRAFVRNAMDRLSNGESIDVEFRVLRDDRQGSVWLKGEPVFDDAGEVVRVVGFTRDITDRKEQSRRLETLISNLPGIVYQCRNEPNWPMDLVRGECDALTGYPATAIERGDPTWSDLIHPDDADRVWERVQDAIDADRPFEVTYRIQTKDGTTRWVWERGRLADSPAHDGEVLEGFITDITDRKEREAELRRTERRYEAVFDDPNILVGLLETDGRVLDVNQTAMAYVEDTRAEIMGTPLQETPWFERSPAVQGRVEEWVTRAANGEYVAFEADLVRSGGEPYTIEGVFRPVTTDDGEVVSLLVSAGDVTDRTERERELERYEAYLQKSSDIITVLDADGTVKYQSPAVTRILGHEPGALVGENGFAYIHPEDVDSVQNAFDDLVAGPDDTVTVECRFRTADDEWRWLEVRGTNQLDKDPIDGIVTNNRDVTERKERERELKRQNARLDQFASVVSHDLRNPLNVAQGRLQLATEECNSEHFDAMARGLDRMERIIEDVLWLAREGQDIGSVGTVPLGDAVADAWSIVADDVADAKLVVDGENGLGSIEADDDRLRQLLENLLRNAVEHGSTNPDSQARQDAVEHSSTSPRSSSTREDAGRASSSEPSVADAPEDSEGRSPSGSRTQSDDAVEHGSTNPRSSSTREDAVEHGSGVVTVGTLDDGFYVADDGPGIPPEDRETIFEAGYSTSDQGTGFGLTIVSQIVEAHGWDVSVTESDSGGARFEITGVTFVDD